jgi:hypothetical protein
MHPTIVSWLFIKCSYAETSRSTSRAVAKRLDGRDAGAARRQGWGLSTVCTDALVFVHPTAQARAGARTRVCSVICATMRWNNMALAEPDEQCSNADDSSPFARRCGSFAPSCAICGALRRNRDAGLARLPSWGARREDNPPVFRHEDHNSCH